MDFRFVKDEEEEEEEEDALCCISSSHFRAILLSFSGQHTRPRWRRLGGSISDRLNFGLLPRLGTMSGQKQTSISRFSKSRKVCEVGFDVAFLYQLDRFIITG